MVDTQRLNEPTSLESSCLDFVRTNLDNLEYSIDGETRTGICMYFIDAICSLPGPMIRSILEFLAKSGSMSDFKLATLLKAAKSTSSPLKRLHLYDIKDNVSVKGLLHYSSYAFEEIILKFDKDNNSQPDINELSQAFQGSETSLQALKLFSYPVNFPEQEHVFNFVTRFPNLKSFCIHTFSENCDIDITHWAGILDSCQSLKELEIFLPKNKGHITLDTSVFSFGGKSIKRLSLPAMLSSSNTVNLVFGLTGLLDLDALSYLDISVDDDPELNNAQVARTERRMYIIDFMEQLEDEHILPNLVSIDLSGLREVHSGHISKLLKSHRKIEFLGLCLLELEYTNKASVAESVNVSNSTFKIICFYHFLRLAQCLFQ